MTSPPPRSWRISSTRPNGGTGSCSRPAARRKRRRSRSAFGVPLGAARCELGELAQGTDLRRPQHMQSVLILTHGAVAVFHRPGKAGEPEIGATAMQVVAPD